MRMRLVLLPLNIIKHGMVAIQPRSVFKVSYSANKRYRQCSFAVIVASSSGTSRQYSNNLAGAVPVGSTSQTTPLLTITFNTNTNGMTTSG